MVNPVKNVSPKNYLSDEKALKRFVRQMIRNHSFVGSYLEKRYVPHLECYKKIIKISKNEEIFIENLSIIKRRLENFYQNSKWIGITTTDTPGAPVGYNIWVDIEEEIFGLYRFCVRDVSFGENYVILKLDIETYKDKGKHSFRESSLNKSSFFETTKNLTVDDDQAVLSWGNFKDAMVFIFLLILTVITGGGQIVKYLLDYILKLLEVSTPIIIAFFNMISRMFGYLCFLIAFLWKGDGQQKRFNNAEYTQRIYYQPAYPYESRYKAIPYTQKNSVVITEVEE